MPKPIQEIERWTATFLYSGSADALDGATFVELLNLLYTLCCTQEQGNLWKIKCYLWINNLLQSRWVLVDDKTNILPKRRNEKWKVQSETGKRSWAPNSRRSDAVIYSLSLTSKSLGKSAHLSSFVYKKFSSFYKFINRNFHKKRPLSHCLYELRRLAFHEQSIKQSDLLLPLFRKKGNFSPIGSPSKENCSQFVRRVNCE